tara:strand:- start:9357 stop:11444 length:2088 start_codon:yes stop_codon:yes gene_type:complete
MAITLAFNPITGNFDSVLLATANVQAWMATPSSANLRAVVSDETGTGVLVFATAPTLTGPVTLTEAVGSSALTITGATQTASFPALNITQTWNNAAVTFTGVYFNVTNTSSATGSLLLSLQVGATDVFKVSRRGVVDVINPGGNQFQIDSVNGTFGAYPFVHLGNTYSGVRIRSADAYQWAPSTDATAAADLFLYRDGAAGSLAQRNSTNAQTFRLYNTYTDASNYERLSIGYVANVATIRNEAAGTGTVRDTSFVYGNTGGNALNIPSFNVSAVEVASGVANVNATGGRLRISNAAYSNATSGTHVDLNVQGGARPGSTSTLLTVGVQIAPIINYSNVTPGAGSYEALKIAVTETALPTGSNYLIRASAGAAGTTDIFYVTNTGVLSVGTSSTTSLRGAIYTAGNQLIAFTRADVPSNAYAAAGIANGTTNGLFIGSGGELVWSTGSFPTGSTFDLKLSRDAAATLAQRNGTNAQTFNIYATYTDASNYERLTMNFSSSLFNIKPEAAGTGTIRALQIGNGSSAVTILGTSLSVTGMQSLRAPGSSDINIVYRPDLKYIGWMSDHRLVWRSADSTAGNSFFSSGSIDTGIGRNAAGVVEVNNGTNGTYRDLKLRAIELVDGNAVLGTTTGTKIGTATTQKLGFWNATPVVQPTTGVTAAAFVANTSGIANDTATFGGYTLGQIVAALKSIGALA